jgi:maltose O-acetyltransferase
MKPVESSKNEICWKRSLKILNLRNAARKVNEYRNVRLNNFLINMFPDGYISDYVIRPFIMRQAGIACGKKCMFKKSIYFSKIRGVAIGDNVDINREVYFDSISKVTIGDNVRIGFRVSLITANHDIGPSWKRAGNLEGQPIVIEKGCWIAACAVIGPGVTIGAGSIVSAGAVVMRSMPANSLIAGNPARVISKLEEQAAYSM